MVLLVAASTLLAPAGATHTFEFAGARDGGQPAAAQPGWSSNNWAGYAIARTRYTAIGAGWTVPTVQAGRGNADTYSVTWIGIDGFSNSSLIQVGTEQDYYRGRAFYRAFYEILPASETVISAITLRPGDYITAGVATSDGSHWKIRITDVTTRQTFTTTASYSGSGASAEWIHEAPNIGSRPTQLTATTPVTFDHATANGANAKLAYSNSGRMARGKHVIATPSRPDSDTDGFTIADGSSVPQPPSS